MSQSLWFALSGSGLFAIGLYGFLIRSHVLRKILAANVMGNGVFMVLIALARRDPANPDPIPHAMVLTGIVIAVSATAFALAIAKRMHQEKP